MTDEQLMKSTALGYAVTVHAHHYPDATGTIATAEAFKEWLEGAQRPVVAPAAPRAKSATFFKLGEMVDYCEAPGKPSYFNVTVIGICMRLGKPCTYSIQLESGREIEDVSEDTITSEIPF